MDSTPYRRFLRKPVSVEFRVRDAEDVASGEILFDSVDLSAGGAFLRSAFLLEPDQQLEVSFQLPDTERRITARARVAWVTSAQQEPGPGMGLEFIDLADADRQAIVELLERARQQLASQIP